ncbi:MAG: DUF429 domain-containing protein [Chloroflexota bacterium]
MFAGIDVGARTLHLVVVDAELRIQRAAVLSADPLDDVTALVAGCRVVAIDAPEALSSAPHATDGTAPNPKFRTARCAEIGLGRSFGIWVPWVTPEREPIAGWMRTGFALFDHLGTTAARVVETYPHGIFRRLAGGPVAPKQTAAGRDQRIALLEAAGIRETGLPMWSHDAIDALAAALLAQRVGTGVATAATCGHDGSAIWIP